MAGRLELDRLVSQTYWLDDINQAYADMLAGRTARGVIVFPPPVDVTLVG
jgi:S-(hydroxymethyl)glutathione dehydrogenase/alcohol dehydrogenase